MKAMKAIVVGRHSGDIPDLEVLDTVNITFSTVLFEVVAQVRALVLDAKEKGADALVFQNAPAILAAALVNIVRRDAEYALLNEGVKIGFLIGKQPTSVGAPRPAGITLTHLIPFIGDEGYNKIVSLVRHANSRAKVEVTELDWGYQDMPRNVSVTVDPVPPFVLDHIEWL